MKAIFAFLIFFSCLACSAQEDTVVASEMQIELDSLMRIKEIRFKDGSKRKYEYRKDGLYIMRLYDRKGRLNSTIPDRMDEEELEDKDRIRPIGHIERLR